MSGGKWLAATMQPEKIRKLSGYFNVDLNVANILTDLVNAYDDNDVDMTRTHLDRCTTDEGAMSPLNAYDPVVMAVAEEIFSQFPNEVAQIRQKRQGDALRIGVADEEIPDEIEEPEEPISADIEREPEEREAIEEESQDTRERKMVAKEPGLRTPEKIEVTRKTTGSVTHRYKAQKWRKPRQPHLSSQEVFVYERRGQGVTRTQEEFATHFKIFRSERSISVKTMRLTKRVSLMDKRREETEKGSDGMVPK